MGRRLGLLIGINHYQDSAFRPLHYAETDASMFARWLENARGGKWSPSDIYTLTGRQVTTEQVESLLAQLCLNAAEPDDLVLIYFAGHAFIDEISGDGLLACNNTSYRQPATALHLPSLIPQVLVPSRAAQVLVLLDCFQTGAAWNAQRLTPFDFRPIVGQSSMMALQQAQGRILYCSCRGNELTSESGEQGLGSFMYRTIVALSGPAVDASTGQATLQQLHVYLSSSLAVQHKPQVFGQSAIPIVLAGELPSYVGVSAPARATASSLSAPSARSAGQVTFQGVGESGPLLEPVSPRSAATGQLSTSTSGPISISQVEQNYQQQCIKLMQQARQLVAMQNFLEALQLIEQVLHMAPTFGDALTLKAQILGSSGRLQEAIAVNEQLLQIEPANALAWSMYAALLNNTSRLQEALTAIDRSLALQPDNQEARNMRQAILSGLPAQTSNQSSAPYAGRWQPTGFPGSSGFSGSPGTALPATRESAASFFIGAALQILAFILGLLGAAIPVLKPSLPLIIGLILQSFGLAALCVLAARGSFRYGISRMPITFLLCVAAAGILVGLYKFEYQTLLNKITALPPLIVPVIFLGAWLIAAAVLPLLAGIGGLIGGIVAGVRRRN